MSVPSFLRRFRTYSADVSPACSGARWDVSYINKSRTCLGITRNLEQLQLLPFLSCNAIDYVYGFYVSDKHVQV